MLVVPTIRLHPNSAILLSEYYSDDGTKLSHGNSGIHGRKQINSTKLSLQARKKMTRAITYMAHLAEEKKVYNPKFNSTFKFRLSFITLTLASRQQHDDTTIKSELLHPFLDWLIKVYKVKFYVWKAERQKNQNIHFHLIIDKYIPYAIIRDKWNKYQDKLSYIRNYWHSRENYSNFPSTQRDYFSVNSTDIHSTRKVKDLGKYMCKYMIKNDTSNRMRVKNKECKSSRGVLNLSKKYFDENGAEITQNQYQSKKQEYKSSRGAPKPKVRYYDENNNEVIKYSYSSKKYLKNVTGIGRIWGCSYNLSNIKGAYDTLHNELMDEIDILAAHKSVYSKNESYFKYISFDNRLLEQLKLYHLRDLLDNYLKDTFRGSE